MKRVVQTPDYNTIMDYDDGYFIRHGRNIRDDPPYSPLGPEILDLEISTVCSRGCPWCYKSNTKAGNNMSFYTFEKIFLKMPRNLTQIAFGIGDLHGNKDFRDIISYCRNNPYNYVVPNITINGLDLDDDDAAFLVKEMGAIAVSHYNDNECFDAVKKLTDLGAKQINIHQMLSQETYEDTINLLGSRKKDERLANLNAIVFLSLKNKGRGNNMHPLPLEYFINIIKMSTKMGYTFGFDSCSALKFLKSNPPDEKILKFVEPCESTLFSAYINSKGYFFPCSFCEGTEEWKKGLSVLEEGDFLQNIWYNTEVIKFRNKLISNTKNQFKCRECLYFKI